MATRPFPADHPADAADGHSSGRIIHHQLTVVATGLAELVPSAGGWLFDRARAGWNVDVLVERGDDTRPLAILGAAPLDGDSGLGDVPPGGALAISAQVLRVDAGVRAHVTELVKRGATEVTVWGEWPVELGEQMEPTDYRLSVAAQAFKARAMVAAKVTQRHVPATETLFELRAGALRALYPV